MQQLKPWQIVLFAAAALAIVYIGYKTIRGNGIDIAHDIVVVDVISGEVYEIDTNGRGIVLPTKNPQTGERTMFPVYKDEEGQWVLDGRGLSAIRSRDLKVGDFLNPETGIVEINFAQRERVNAKDLVKRQ